MTQNSLFSLLLFGFMPVLYLGCGSQGPGDETPTPGDDDATLTGDDDGTTGDDDSSTGDDDASSNPSPTPSACGEGRVKVDGACVPDLAENWTSVKPGGETICARGDEFSYSVRKGKVNKLVVGFDGGGACWDTITCSAANPTFTDKVDANDDPNTLHDGVFDMDNPENPFKDWYAVYIPYCTGDIHWGNNVVHYPAENGFPPVTIRHKGFLNATAVMDWIYANFDSPEEIFITGVSAGSYGTMMYTPYLIDHYPDARVVQLGDSGAGVVTQEFIEESFNNWNAQVNFPSWIPVITTTPPSQLTMNDVYIQVANYYPEQVLAQYNTQYDSTQEFYFQAMGGDPSQWTAGMNQNIATIVGASSNFRAYNAWGDQHGILPYSEFYTYQVNGVRVRDWVNDLVSGSDPGNVHCSDCDTAEYHQP